MNSLKEEVLKRVDEIELEVIKIRQKLHSYPELSGKEAQTREFIKDILTKYSIPFREFENHYGLIADIDIENSKNRVAFRGDMDALPMQELNECEYKSKIDGVMHSCGHDSHTAITLGCAIALSKYRDRLKNSVRFIFQPSEESLIGGSSEMIDSGALDEVDAIFGLHSYPYLNSGEIGYKYREMMASADMFEVEIFGKSSHGARPHEGVDAILVTSMIVNSLNHIVSRRIDPIHPAVISLGTIQGGDAPNILCNHVLLRGTVRTLNDSVRSSIAKMMEESIEGVCKSMGAKYKFDYQFGIPELVNSDKMVDLLIQEAKGVVGESGCIDLVEPVMGGEDFSKYLQVVDGAFFRLGTCSKSQNSCSPQHSSYFDIDDKALKYGIKIFSAIALEFESAK